MSPLRIKLVLASTILILSACGESDTETSAPATIATVPGSTSPAEESSSDVAPSTTAGEVAVDPADETPIRDPNDSVVIAPTEIDLMVAEAKASDLFTRELPTSELMTSSVADVAIDVGTEVSLASYVAATSLIDHLQSVDTQPIQSVSNYSETVIELTDRFVIDRVLEIEIDTGACNATGAGANSLCFTTNASAVAPPQLANHLSDVRARLASEPSASPVANGVTAAMALQLSDVELLDLMLNTGTRTVRRLSIVPRATAPIGQVFEGTRDFTPGAIAITSDDVGEVVPRPRFPTRIPFWNGPPEAFDTEYFLTGFTLGKAIDDTWEYTIADESWWHDRYFIKLDYHLTYGFGLRAPFSVDVAYQSGGASSMTVALEVAPIDVGADGKPAYPAVNLPSSKYFDGDEFVLEVTAGCSLQVSIPGRDPDPLKCPELDKDFSRDIDPVIGSDTSSIKDWWIPSELTGLEVDLGVASAALEVGVGLDVVNGRIGIDIEPLTNTSLDGNPDTLWIDSTNPSTITVNRLDGEADPGFRLSEPKYAFSISLQPKIRAVIEVDLAIYSNDWTLGPWATDWLSLSAGFQLEHHDGTVAHHDYILSSPDLVLAPVVAAP